MLLKNLYSYQKKSSLVDFVEVIVKFNGDLETICNHLSAKSEILSCNYAILTIPSNELSLLYSYKEIEYVEFSKNISGLLQENLRHAGVTQVKEYESYSLNGKGVIIGIVDSGIDYTHKDFRNPDGSTRILSLWDQNGTENPPQGFLYGTEYTREQINEALRTDNPYSVVTCEDRIGHGTAVAGIAAGNGATSNGIECGIASQAELIIVSLGNHGNRNTTRTTQIMRAVKYISDKAQQQNMPLSINLSYGTNDGLHDGKSLFELFLNDMCSKWKTVISVAAGNEGSAGHHFHCQLSSNQTKYIEFVWNSSQPEFYLCVRKSFCDEMNFELISPSNHTSGILFQSQHSRNIIISGFAITILQGLPTHYNSNPEIVIRFIRQTSTVSSGVWKIIIRSGNIIDGTCNIWMPTIEEVSTNSFFFQPESEATLTIPATSENVISVGGYYSNTETYAEFSGRGWKYPFPKPDIIAPAVNIYTCRAGGGYDSYTGTSMAAPFVCGGAALLMEWGIVRGNDPFLYGQKIKAFIQKSANRFSYINYPDTRWGYGTLNLFNAIRELSS